MGVIYTPLEKGTKKEMHRKQTEMIKQYEKESGKLMETTVIQTIQSIVRFLIKIKVNIGKIV